MREERDRDAHQRMQDAIRLRQERRKAWESEGERPLWQNLSVIGSLGWLIVVPVLIGVFVGRWLDDRFGTGVTLSGALTFVGAGLGFYLAWRRMNEK